MKLHPPFLISSHLAPALRIADATLSLIGEEYEGDRTRCTFVLETPDFTYTDASMSTGCGHHSTVEIFETFLSFMQACGEGIAYERRTGTTSENSTLFPEHVASWMEDNLAEVELAHCDLCDPEDGCTPLNHLIEED